MKKHYKAVKQVVLSHAEEWQMRMGLAHFTIEHVFLDSFFGDDGDEDFKVTATTEVRWNYLQAKIKWYLPSCTRHEEDVLEKTLVHELCHVLLAAEQALIDNRIEDLGGNLGHNENEALEARYYERMELATEMTCRAIWNTWHEAKN